MFNKTLTILQILQLVIIDKYFPQVLTALPPTQAGTLLILKNGSSNHSTKNI